MPKPSVKGRIHLDEVELKLEKKIWCINAVDSRTKYNLGSRLVWSRVLEEFDEFFGELKNRIGEQVHRVFQQEKHKNPNERKLVTLVSDKLWQYRTAFNRYFYRIAKLVFGVPIACKRLWDKNIR
jgi:hypothetical protein